MGEVPEGNERLIARMLSCFNRDAGELPWYEIFQQEVQSAEHAKPLAIGLDTNVLKALRREPLYADALATYVQNNSVRLVIPGQAVQEFWNNHSIFVKDAWNPISGDLKKISQKLDKVEALPGHKSIVEEAGRQLASLMDELDDYQDPDMMQKSLALWDALLPVADIPFVPRESFAAIGRTRIDTKTPPGFDDASKANNRLGDYFAWADFLYGLAKSVGLGSEVPPSTAVFVTDDVKDDWRTGGFGHPILLAECAVITGYRLRIMPLKEFRSWLPEISA